MSHCDDSLVISTVADISSDDPCDLGPFDLDRPTVALESSSIDSVDEPDVWESVC